ncbi:unnamed protein product, partial [Ectocarpus sp. 12 AP-2014]
FVDTEFRTRRHGGALHCTFGLSRGSSLWHLSINPLATCHAQTIKLRPKTAACKGASQTDRLAAPPTPLPTAKVTVWPSSPSRGSKPRTTSWVSRGTHRCEPHAGDSGG